MPDVLIGNFKGPQGETGPANKLLATVYQFCESNDGQKIPDGPWLEELPEIQKGKYYWCRNIMTWDEGEDSVLYSVGYVGLDGEFTGTDLLEELKKRVDALETRTTSIDKGGTGSTTLDGAQAKLGITQLRTDMQTADKALDKRIDGINDYTTGINLVRGSRDFNAGTSNQRAGAYNDGWSNVGASFVSKMKDTDGISYLRFTATSDSDKFVDTNYIDSIKVGDEFTIFGLLRLNETMQDSQVVYSLIPLKSDDTPLAKVQFTLKSLGVDVSKRGVWQPYKAYYKVTSADCDAIIPRPSLRESGSIDFKLPGINSGSINNPIYASNPNDIDYINDYTTGINLIKGSRDFRLGNVNSVYNGNYKTDGFANLNGFTFYKDKEGFTVAKKTASGLSANGDANLAASEIYINPANGETLTISFEMMLDSGIPFDQQTILRIYQYRGDGNTVTQNMYISAEQMIDGFKLSSVDYGKWYECKYSYTIPANTEIIRVLLTLQRNGSINFRKPIVQHGTIKRTIWDASPFDVASSYEWDNGAPMLLGNVNASNIITSGANLNDYKIPGTYICPTNAISNDVDNNPNKGKAFKLYVDQAIGTPTYLFQRIRYIDETAVEYIRYTSDGGSYWHPFRQTYANTTVRPYEGGGTNANTLAGAKSNLGITALETRVKTLEDQLAALTS